MFQFTNYDPDFWVQLKGSAAGKPLREPIPNSIGVKVNPRLLVSDFLFYTIEYLFQSGAFKPYIIGSVVPYIRQSSITKVLIQHWVSSKSLVATTHILLQE